MSKAALMLLALLLSPGGLSPLPALMYKPSRMGTGASLFSTKSSGPLPELIYKPTMIESDPMSSLRQAFCVCVWGGSKGIRDHSRRGVSTVVRAECPRRLFLSIVTRRREAQLAETLGW